MRPAIQDDTPAGDFQEITVGADFDLAGEISETKRRHLDGANPEAQTDRSRGSRRVETEEATRVPRKQQMKHRKVSTTRRPVAAKRVPSAAPVRAKGNKSPP